ncbi:MAG: hypothetical protein AB4038_13035 [Prochloraceae cyanobacterium]
MGIVTSILGSSTKAITNYLGITDSLGVKFNKLINSELNAGILALKQAQFSNVERESLLREARTRLNKAIYLEKEERLVSAYLGLAMCHQQLGDQENAKLTLTEFAQQEFNFSVSKKLISNIKGEIGVIQSDLAEGIGKMFPFKKKIAKKLKFSLSVKTGNYLEQKIGQLVSHGEETTRENYHKYFHLERQIKEYQEEAIKLVDSLDNQISPHNFSFLTGDRE